MFMTLDPCRRSFAGSAQAHAIVATAIAARKLLRDCFFFLRESRPSGRVITSPAVLLPRITHTHDAHQPAHLLPRLSFSSETSVSFAILCRGALRQQLSGEARSRQKRKRYGSSA